MQSLLFPLSTRLGDYTKVPYLFTIPKKSIANLKVSSSFEVRRNTSLKITFGLLVFIRDDVLKLWTTRCPTLAVYMWIAAWTKFESKPIQKRCVLVMRNNVFFI